jgi:hypothetical protein
MWINQKNAEPDEQLDSVQGLQNSLRSGEIGYLTSIPKLSGFSQSLLRVQKVVISYGRNQISPGLK